MRHNYIIVHKSTKNMALSIEYRKKISESLPRGAKSAIAKKLGIQRQNISNWFLNGRNPRIEKAVLDCFTSYTKEIEAERLRQKEVMAFLDKID